MKLKNRCIIHIYRGEDRTLIIPMVELENSCFFLQSEWYVKLSLEASCEEVGRAVRECINYLIETPIIQCDSIEYREKAAWKQESKFKNWNTFARHNELVSIVKNEDTLEINVTVRAKAGGSYDPIQEFVLPFDASEKTIGSVIEKSFKITNDFYKKS